MDLLNIKKIGELTATSVAETTTHRVWLEEAGFDIDVISFDFGPNEDLRYSYEAHIADKDLVAKLGDDVPRSLCYGNSAGDQDVAWATLHWDGLRKVLQIMKERGL